MSDGVAGLWPDEPEPSGGRRAVPPAPGGRPRRGWRVVLVAAAVALGGGTAVASGALDAVRGAGQVAPAPEPVVLASPTPTIAPVARASGGPFADSLPSSVLAYALTAFTEDTAMLAAGALEGYRLDYSDGGGGTLTVVAGQWATPAGASEALAAVRADGTPVDDGEPATGEVLVSGEPVGTWSLTRTPDGVTSMSWSNGTVLLVAQVPAAPAPAPAEPVTEPSTGREPATEPADALRQVFAAYPL